MTTTTVSTETSRDMSLTTQNVNTGNRCLLHPFTRAYLSRLVLLDDALTAFLMLSDAAYAPY
jgi:hypothetical protein